MSKKLQLQIPVPCHENWENMTPIEKGRFCASCQKKVIDFSDMSDREIAMFFKKPSNGSVCGRFMENQLNRNIEIPRKRIPWMKYFFQFLLPAYLISCKSNAQVKVPVIIKNEKNLNSNCIRATLGELSLPNIQKKKKQITTIFPEVRLPVTSKDSIPSYKVTPVNYDVTPIQQSLVGFVGGAVATRCYAKKTPKPIQLLQKIFKDTLFSNFNIYPNPVPSNSALHIEWKQRESGYHLLQLFNQSGQLVFTNELFIDKEAKLLSINIPQVVAGSYFVKISDKATGKSYIEKLVVE